MSSVVVFGGTGLLGRRVCQAALAQGHAVTSVSGSGRAPAAVAAERWASAVNWQRGDVFRPETYRHLLTDATAVVHSIGILLENSSYKGVVRSNASVSSLLGAVGGASGSSGSSSANPMARKETASSSTPAVDYTYANYNYRSALVLAETLLQEHKNANSAKNATEPPAFVYVSADRGFPGGVCRGYIDTKRQAELDLMRMAPSLRPILLRPGFLYDPQDSSTFRNTLKQVFSLADGVNKSVLRGSLDFLVRPAVATTQVAHACLRRIDDPAFSGIVSLDDMLKESTSL